MVAPALGAPRGNTALPQLGILMLVMLTSAKPLADMPSSAVIR